MSDSIRTEDQRRIAELESLVAGLSNHVGRIEDDLDRCRGTQDSMLFELAQAAWKLRKAEKALEAARFTSNPQEC
jgi:hypothetical protein